MLVVDDDPGVLRVIRRCLDGHDVVTAADGWHALAILQVSTDFDLLLTDVDMPGMSGVELWCEIAARHPGLVQRIVFMTGGTQIIEDAQFLDSGDLEVLRKPFSLDVLHRLVGDRADSPG